MVRIKTISVKSKYFSNLWFAIQTLSLFDKLDVFYFWYYFAGNGQIEKSELDRFLVDLLAEFGHKVKMTDLRFTWSKTNTIFAAPLSEQIRPLFKIYVK